MLSVFRFILDMGALLLLLLVVNAVVTLVCNWVIYMKIGLPGWHSVVPFFNTISLANTLGYPLLGYAFCASLGAVCGFALAGVTAGGVGSFVCAIFSTICLPAVVLTGFLIQYQLIVALERPAWYIILCAFMQPVYLCLMAFTD